MIKMIAMVKRHPSLTRAEFLDYWLNKHAPLVRSVPSFWQYIRGYKQNHTVQNIAFYEGAELDGGYDGCGEMWFDSFEDLKKATSEPAYLEIIRPDELKLFDDPATVPMILAVEHVMLAKG